MGFATKEERRTINPKVGDCISLVISGLRETDNSAADGMK